jgi:predicted transposase/invertase (TIGR01784 family)
MEYTMTSKVLHNPHDRLFQRAMGYPELAREFLETHLPEEIKKHLDFATLSICPNSFIDQELKLLQSDVLMKAKISKKDAFVYLLTEHQSQPDKLMPFRLLQYMIKIWSHHIKEKKSPLPLPVIVPLVFYTGDGEYRADKTIWDLCGAEAPLMQTILTKPFAVINVNLIPESVVQSRLWAGTLEFVMRSHFKKHIPEDFIKIANKLNTLLQMQNRPLVIELLVYITNIDEQHRSFEELIKVIQGQMPKNMENAIMTLADYVQKEWFGKGMEKGLHKANLATARKMLLAGCKPEFIMNMTEISSRELRALQQELSIQS